MENKELNKKGTKIEKNFNEEFNFAELKQETESYIKEVLKNYEVNLLEDCEEKLPKDVKLKDLKIEYYHTNIILNKEYGAELSFRLAFNLINPINEDILFIYEVEYNSNREFSDEFLIDY